MRHTIGKYTKTLEHLLLDSLNVIDLPVFFLVVRSSFILYQCKRISNIRSFYYLIILSLIVFLLSSLPFPLPSFSLLSTILFMTQSKQKGEAPPDVARASEEIENVLLRKKVFDLLASTATVTWIDAPAAASE